MRVDDPHEDRPGERQPQERAGQTECQRSRVDDPPSPPLNESWRSSSKVSARCQSSVGAKRLGRRPLRLDDPDEAVGAHPRAEARSRGRRSLSFRTASAAARLTFVEVRELVVDGSPTAYRVAGEGEPVVLVHGLSGSWRWWRPVLEPLTERRRVYVPDLPRLGRRLPAAELTGWFGRWLDAAGLERVDLIGHSLGGLIAAELAAEQPSRARRLALVAPAGIPCGTSLLSRGAAVGRDAVRPEAMVTDGRRRRAARRSAQSAARRPVRLRARPDRGARVHSRRHAARVG